MEPIFHSCGWLLRKVSSSASVAPFPLSIIGRVSVFIVVESSSLDASLNLSIL